MRCCTPIRKAIIPVIGQETWFTTTAKVHPQEMMTIIDKPAIQYVVEEAIQSGIQEILIITRGTMCSFEALYGKDIRQEMMFSQQAKNNATLTSKDIQDVKIYFTHQTECYGLGHAVLCARQFIDNEPFAVLFSNEINYAAVPVLKQLLDIYQYYPGTILGVQKIDRSKVQKYVIVKPITLNERMSRIIDLIDRPSASKAPSRLAVVGRCIFDPDVFSILEKMALSGRNEILFTNVLRQLAVRKPLYAYQTDGQRYDIGEKQGYLEASIEFALKRNDTREAFRQYLRETILPILMNQ